MKLAAIVFFTFLTSAAFSQYSYEMNSETGIAIGISGGYTSKQCMVGNLSAGAMLPQGNHMSFNMVILGAINNPDMPSIFEARMGHLFKTIEVFGGAGYHIAGSDGKISTDPNTGFRPAYGIIKHFNFNRSKYTLSTQMSGNIFSIQVGIFGIR